MDVGTHVLASFALTRAAFPRAPRSVLPIALAAGVIADLDEISAVFGPTAYLNWHRTYMPSLLTAILLAVLLALLYCFVASQKLRNQFSFVAIFLLTFLAQCLHLLLDLCQPDGVVLFWPFSAARIAKDWLTFVDPVILAVPLVAIFFPRLLHTVRQEIRDQATKKLSLISARLPHS